MSSKRKVGVLAGFVGALLMAGQTALAGGFSVNPNSDDTIVGKAYDTGANPLGYRVNNPDDRVGTTGPSLSNRIDQQKVFGFTLPVLDLPTISQATFRIENDFISPALPFNVDLYGLNTANPDGSGTSLFYEGPDDPTQSYKVDDVIKGDNSTPLPIMADVTSFIQSLYTGTSPNQTEAFFRLNPNTEVALIASPADAQNVVLRPGTAFLIINTVPEPGTAAISLVGVLLLSCRRRRGLASHAGR